MDEQFKKSMRTLELPQILHMLAEHAVCDETKEKIAALLPSSNCAQVRRMIDETEAARDYLRLKGGPPLRNVRDTAPMLRRAEQGGMLNMRELLEIAGLLTATRRLKRYAGEGEGAHTCIDDLFRELAPDKALEDTLLTSILSEEEMADSASPALQDIRRAMRRANTKVRDTLQHIITSPAYSKYLQEAIITQRSGRYVVPVRSEYKGSIQGLTHDVSSSGATFFIEPIQVVELNNELRELQAKEKKEIERILYELTAKVADRSDALLRSYGMLVAIDMAFAKGRFADRLRACVPEIREAGAIELRRARHPLLPAASVVPVSLSLGGAFDTLVVTGPNTGGKTVTLKTIGLLTMMAACGLHIPADDGSAVPVFDGIYADIGDEQSIEQSLSTFSSHMTNIVGILSVLQGRSLVLFDELGAGTDPLEGAALAIAIIERTRGMGAAVAATTHYAELKEFALKTEGVENASCEFDVETLRPTYKLILGIPGKSNAFAISRRLKLPEAVIASAERILDRDSRDFEDVLAVIEKQKQEAEAERTEIRKRLLEAEKAAADAEAARTAVEKEIQAARERATAEARRIVDGAREEVESIVEEMKALRKRAGEENITDELNRARAELRGRLNRAEARSGSGRRPAVRRTEPRQPLKPGDTVQVVGSGTKGTVLTPPDSAGNLTIQAGIMKLTLKAEDVELTANRPDPTVQRYLRSVERKMAEGVSAGSGRTEIDIRGMTADEGLMEVDRLLDHASLVNLPSVTIIHGKGTGALRAAVQKHLRTHAQVKAFRLGTYGEGEMGVTIVELR
ncbi:endonuclease MutS2 [Oscillospiraceae bacterium OttesenSCG-928-F05]|nr:endonuclease MutS2 [Oscillospiraceae bacterium OttesenSCG-928-F05]